MSQLAAAPGDNETVFLSLMKCDSQSNVNRGTHVVYGILVSFLAALSFGSMFVPTKKFKTGKFLGGGGGGGSALLWLHVYVTVIIIVWLVGFRCV